jgi:uncharacterized membrane protein YhaH (DUF805 family)
MISLSGSEGLAVLLILVWVLIPIPFIVKRPPSGPNRFGSVSQPMGFLEAVAAFFRDFANFSGRASRSEFWWAILFNVLVVTVASFVPLLGVAWTVISFLPAISLATRRLHDINRGGWFQLLSISLPVGTVALIVWYCQPPRDADDWAN